MISLDILEQINELNIPEDSNLYRLFSYQEEHGDIFYGIDSNANLVFGIRSSHPNMQYQLQYTKNLVLSTNLKCQAIIDGTPHNMTVHLLTCLSKDQHDQMAFIRLTEAFTPYFSADKPYAINELFSDLVNLFSQTNRINLIELQGLYSELYVILFFFNKGLNISTYWQKKDKSNFDFSFSSSKRMEVKSTTRAERIHHFRHEQLLSDIYDIIIVSILLRKDDKGKSLFEIIEEARSTFSTNFSTLFQIDRCIKNFSDEELRNISYDTKYIDEHIKFYFADKIPKFNSLQPDGVTHTEYDSDLSTTESISFDDLSIWIRNGGLF